MRIAIINAQGRPSPIKISKILEPTALLNAMPPRPCLATITEEIISGTEVPIAKTVSAMTTFGTRNSSEIITALSTRAQLKSAISNMLIKKTE